MSGVRQSGVGSILVYVGTVKFCTFLVVNNFYYQKYISTYKGWATSSYTLTAALHQTSYLDTCNLQDTENH